MIEYTYLPRWWWLMAGGVLLAAVLLASYLPARGRSSRRLRIALSGLRWLILALIVFCLFDPEWVEAIKRQAKSRLAVLLDTSRSMNIKDLPQQRLAAAKHWIQQSLAPAVPAEFGTQYYAFDQRLQPLAEVGAAQASGDGTGIADALESLLSVSNDDPLAGVVICSDGIETRRSDAEALARTYRRKGIPVHTLTLGTTNEVRDIVVENVQVRRAVPNEAPTRLTARLRSFGYSRRTVPVQILHQNQLVAVEDVALTDGSQNVEIDFTPRQKGFQVYEVRIPAQAGEWLAGNNQRRFGLEVIDPTIRVLYMEGTPQQPDSSIPEWKYLQSALVSDPHIKVKTLYREFSASGKRLETVDIDPETGARIYPVEHPTQGFPRTLAELLDYDVVIHSDIRKESFTAQQLANMARLVEEFGGGFVMIGGNSAFGKGGYHRTILDRVIPAAMRQENDSEARPFQLQVPPTVWAHPIIALGRSRAETELIWTKKLPLLYGCNLVERAKPGAVVLGYDPSSRTARGPRLILAVQNVGRGRSMAFTSDTTRTWGKDFETLWGEKINASLPLSEANCDRRYYRQFWVNAVRWLAAGRIGKTNTAVGLELAQSSCRPDEKITAIVKVRDSQMREITTAQVSLVATLEGKTNLTVKAPYDSATRSYVAQIVLPTAGDYHITASAALKGAPLGDDRQLLVCEESDREMSEVRANPVLMAALARLSNGQTLSLSNTDSAMLRSVFQNSPPVTVEYRRNPIWDRSWWLAAVLGLLSVEWAVRRLNGMA